MKFCGLLALGLPAAQAFRITLYAGDGCTGDSFLALDPVKACVLPAGLPASFDAQSIRVEETPPTCQVWMFTDASLRCDTFQKDTWRFWSNVSQGECFSLNSYPNGTVNPHDGKWQKPYVFCPT